MPQRLRHRFTILRAMGCVAVVGSILALVAGRLEDLVAMILVPSLVIVLPADVAIEANRRDAIEAGLHHASPDQQEHP